MRDHDDLPYVVIERHSGGGSSFFWGALVGAVAGMLLAPRSGAETQEEIRSRFRQLRDTAEGTLDSVTSRVDSMRSTIDSQADRARGAVDTGRRAARQARSELERRLARARAGHTSSDPIEPLNDDFANPALPGAGDQPGPV
jgi:gas vesicle protein